MDWITDSLRRTPLIRRMVVLTVGLLGPPLLRLVGVIHDPLVTLICGLVLLLAGYALLVLIDRRRERTHASR